MKKRSYHVLSNSDSAKQKHKNTSNDEAKVNYNDLQSSTSNTQYFKRDQNTGVMKKIISTETVSDGSSETFNCDHRPVEKQCSEKKLLNKFLTKIIDPIKIDAAWINQCPSAADWDIAKSLDFMVRDQVANQHIERLQCQLQEFAEISKFGFKIHVLDNLCVILDFLVENMSRRNQLKESFTLLLRNLNQPVLLNTSSDVITYFESLSKFICFMGYLLIRLEEDDHFDLVSKALIWHLSASDSRRCKGSVRLSHTLPAAVGLCETAVRMLCVASIHRFPTFLEIALLLACNDVNNCITMLKDNVLECLFYRFNPYFPERDLPVYEINPADPQDINVKLGASSVHISSTLSLLLVFMKTAKDILENDPKFCLTLPCPDSYSQRCFAWAYRYECRAREHRHERITLTIVASSLIHCFGERLTALSEILMADILSLSVRTEVPLRKDWTNSVHFNTGQLDVYFKKALIQLSVQLLKTFPYNKFMVESRLWILGLMYLLDPGLCKLRARWSPSLFAELRKTAFQALISVMPITSPKLAKDYGLIRRLMWYIEWYSESPYQLSVLYWCLRVLQVAICRRKSSTRQTILKDLFDSHGIFIVIRLCHTLLDQKLPPVQKSQIIISLCLRLLTDALEVNARISCCVYPEIKWPSSVNTLATRMLDVTLNSLQKHLILSDRFLISLLNFVWEAIVWNDKYRGMFVMDNGVYKLLDFITLTRSPIQCLALALLCDVARAGEAVAQMITWRASPAASDIHPILVRRGATIATLLAAIFRDECYIKKVNISSDGVLQDLNCPLMSPEIRELLKNYDFCQDPSTRMPESLAASDLAGSRMSKVYAILHMLSKDLAFKMSIADEAYNLYKNIKLSPQDETILVLCSHYLTFKLNETWVETKTQCPGLLPQDNDTLEEFLQIANGWAKEVQQLQEGIIKKSKEEEYASECSLYEFLSRVRLNIALDALREIRCMARSTDYFQISHALLHDAVWEQQRRAELSKNLHAPIIKTYTAPLDVQNIIGQHVKVSSIKPKEKEISGKQHNN